MTILYESRSEILCSWVEGAYPASCPGPICLKSNFTRSHIKVCYLITYHLYLKRTKHSYQQMHSTILSHLAKVQKAYTKYNRLLWLMIIANMIEKKFLIHTRIYSYSRSFYYFDIKCEFSRVLGNARKFIRRCKYMYSKFSF